MTDTFDSIARQYYGKNYDKAMRLAKDTREEMKRDFLNKYPNANINKFDFEVSVDKDLHVERSIYYKLDDKTSYDITSDTFKNNKNYTKCLHWKAIWNVGGTIQPYEKNTNEFDVSNFRIYVTDNNWFYGNFKRISQPSWQHTSPRTSVELVPNTLSTIVTRRESSQA